MDGEGRGSKVSVNLLGDQTFGFFRHLTPGDIATGSRDADSRLW